MSTVNFRCPYCGRSEIHPTGIPLPEMCGNCLLQSVPNVVEQPATASPPIGAATQSRPAQSNAKPQRRVKASAQNRAKAGAARGPVIAVSPSGGPPAKPPKATRTWARFIRRTVIRAAVLIVLLIATAKIMTTLYPPVPGEQRILSGNYWPLRKLGFDGDYNAVIAWMHRNWGSEDWSELEWSPAVAIYLTAKGAPELHAQKLESLKAERKLLWDREEMNPKSPDPDFALGRVNSQISKVEQNLRDAMVGPDRVCALRIRDHKALIVTDLTFVIKPGGEIRYLPNVGYEVDDVRKRAGFPPVGPR